MYIEALDLKEDKELAVAAGDCFRPLETGVGLDSSWGRAGPRFRAPESQNLPSREAVVQTKHSCQRPNLLWLGARGLWVDTPEFGASLYSTSWWWDLEQTA